MVNFKLWDMIENRPAARHPLVPEVILGQEEAGVEDQPVRHPHSVVPATNSEVISMRVNAPKKYLKKMLLEIIIGTAGYTMYEDEWYF